MPLVVDRQVSWASGELSPTLYGRTDLPYYRHGARTLHNFLVTPHGVLKNRPGTQFIERLTDTTLGKPRLIPYVFSNSENAILALFRGRIRPWSQSELNPRFKFEYQREGTTSSVFDWGWDTDAKIAKVRHAQLGKVVTFVGPDFPPQEVTRTDTDWVRSVVPFDVLQLQDAIWTSLGQNPPWVYPAGDTSAKRNLALNGDSTHPTRRWTWAVTYILKDEDGNVFETSAYIVTRRSSSRITAPSANVSDDVAIYPDAPWGVIAPATSISLAQGKAFLRIGPGNTVAEIVSARFYRGREGLFGFIGEAPAKTNEGAPTSPRFEDEGNEPDLSNPPPAGFNPFDAADNYPSCVTYHEGRRFFGSTNNAPQRIWGSGVQRFTDFDEVTFADDSDSLAFTITTSRKNEIIRGMVARGRLYLLTSSGVRVAAGSGDQEIITPNSIAVRSLADEGCADLDVVESPKGVWFLEASASSPRVLLTDGQQAQVVDPTFAAMHLFEGYTITGWAWAENPWRILYVVRSDGKLLSCTYVPELNVLAWSTHTITDCFVVDVATKPEGVEDGVYLAVHARRTGQNRRYEIHRLAYRIFSDIRDAVFLDSCVTYNGLNTLNEDLMTAAFKVTASSGFGVGATVTVTFDDTDATGWTGRVLQWDDPDGGRPYRIQLGAEGSTGVYTSQVLARGAENDAGIPTAFQGVDIEEWYICTQSVSGLSHLNGQTVTAVADGQVIPNLTVSGGGVDVGDQYGVIHVGQPYESEFESLDHFGGDSNRGRQKVIKAASVELEHSSGGKVGGSLTGRLTPIKASIDPTVTAQPLVHREERVVIADAYDRNGRIALVQDQPMPITILGITREVEYGGR